MADEKLLKQLLGNVSEWNEWRRTHKEIEYYDLTSGDFSGANLFLANLSGVDLTGANLAEATLRSTRLSSANLTRTYLRNTDLSFADLRCANLYGAQLYGTNLTNAWLSSTNFKDAIADSATFSELNLRGAEGLDEVKSQGPSIVSINTIYMSEGIIPEGFLRGCGVPESLILQIPALVAAMQPIQFYSCFISYGGKDEEFARRLHARMRQARLRVWFAPEDMQGGDKIYDQIDRAIQVHDRLLLVLSEYSLKSKWVENEIRRARKVELREERRKLFPIRLVGYEALQEWVCIDSATGEDLAEEVRSYFIPDFSNWKNHDDFDKAFARLLDDLKASV